MGKLGLFGMFDNRLYGILSGLYEPVAGRCRHGNYRAHMRIPDVTALVKSGVQSLKQVCFRLL